MAQSNNSISFIDIPRGKNNFYKNVKHKKTLNAQPYQFKDNANTTEKYIAIENNK